MAADTFVHSDYSGFYVGKIVRVKGHLVGCAGTSEWCEKFVDWYSGRRKRRWTEQHFCEALVLTKEGLYYYSNDFTPNRILDSVGYHAIGSGRQYALGAYAVTKDLLRSVTIASRFDPYTKPPIILERL